MDKEAKVLRLYTFRCSTPTNSGSVSSFNHVQRYINDNTINTT
jgi:hypothetical protein